MKIRISGINGYLGSVVSNQLRLEGHQVAGIERSLLYGSPEALASEIQDTEVIINLAGASILRRWTARNKKIIYDSRVKTTRNLVKAINLLPTEQQPKKIISASAIGIYKTDETHDENSTNFDTGFLGKVIVDWESQLNELPDSVQKIIFRIGLVLGKNTKTIKYMLPAFKLGIGGTIGSGKQAFPFIHIEDLANAFIWAINNDRARGNYNLVAPQKITNKEFTKALASQLNRPAFLRVPEFILKFLFGEASQIFISSPFVVPGKLQKEAFRYKYNNINVTLSQLTTNSSEKS